jgi:hypothetical protein
MKGIWCGDEKGSETAEIIQKVSRKFLRRFMGGKLLTSL